MHLLIDAKNCIYRAAWAAAADQRFLESQYDFSVILLRLIGRIVDRLKPKSLHIFWDSPRSTLWRLKILPQYKHGRGKTHDTIDVNHEVWRMSAAVRDFFDAVGARQYELKSQEADDLIYAFCRVVNDKTIVVSSDSDLLQLLHFDHVSIWTPASHKLIDSADEQEVQIKCLAGDKGDGISGYWQIGRSRAKALLSDETILNSFFESPAAKAKLEGIMVPVGKSLFDRNKKLIALDENPYLSEVLEYIKNIMRVTPKASMDNVYHVACKHRLRGFMSAFNQSASSFKLIHA